MPEFHAEPYVYLAGLTHKSALIAWGGFYFRVHAKKDDFKLIDDSHLRHVHPPRRETIGARSEPYGKAVVRVFDQLSGELAATASTESANHCWINGLQPDRGYRYEIEVNGEEWGGGERRDWVVGDGGGGLKLAGGRYVNQFRTFPHPQQPPPEEFSFAVIGDFGTGVKKPSDKTRRQREVARALQKAAESRDIRFVLTTGDNIYAQMEFLGIPLGDTGDEDDDWFFTFYQPYRYIINRIPVFPSIGNHDTAESEVTDDRGQLMDNFYLRERLAGEEEAGRASLGPGLFYRFRFGSSVEFICLDTSKEAALFFRDRLFELPKHFRFLEDSLPSGGTDGLLWRIPFCHHPPFSAGPRHHNTQRMAKLLPLFQRAGVRAVFSGHEHNFQHNAHQGVDYFVSGAAGKTRSETPDRFERAHTLTWSPACHFLLVTIQGRRMSVRALGELNGEGELTDIERFTPAKKRIQEPIEISLPD